MKILGNSVIIQLGSHLSLRRRGGRRLVQRQEAEIAYYNRAKAEIEAAQKANMPAAQLSDLWEKRNESLRQMGVKLVPMPE